MEVKYLVALYQSKTTMDIQEIARNCDTNKGGKLDK